MAVKNHTHTHTFSLVIWFRVILTQIYFCSIRLLNADVKSVSWSKTSWDPLALYHSHYLERKKEENIVLCTVSGMETMSCLSYSLFSPPFAWFHVANLSFDRSHFLSLQPTLDDWLVITEGRCCIWCVMCYSNLYVSVDRFQDNQWVVIRTN